MMFDSIIYKSARAPGPLIDVGALAEGLLFYGRVAIVGNGATLEDIVARIPPFVLLSLLRDGRLEFHHLADQIGVATTPMSNGRSLHQLIRFSSPDHTVENDGIRAFAAAAGGTGKARRGARQFAQLLRPLDHSAFDQDSVLQALSDISGTQASVDSLVRTVVPGLPPAENLRFRVNLDDGGFYVDTNIDFARLNELYHKAVPPAHSSLGEAYILAALQGAYEATYFAGVLDSEVAVDAVERVVQAEAVEAIVRRYERSESEIDSFVELTLSDGHAIREAVNSGAVSFSAVVELLESADKFRHWLREQPPDASLVRAFYQETIKDSWAEKLPTKTMRWAVFAGLGLVVGGLGPAAGVALGAADAFLIDKLIKGWKPHQFVEGDLKSLFDPPQK